MRLTAPMMIGGVLAACLVAVWYLWPVPPVKVAAPAPQVADLPKVAIQPPKVIKAYAPKAKARLGLPKAVQADPGIYALSAARTPADERPHTLVTTLDMETGEAVTYDRPEPLPWFASETRGELGISYGLRDGVPMGRLTLRQNLLQVKQFRFGGQASLDQDGEWFAGVGLWYRW